MAIKFTKSPVYSTGNSIKFSNTGNVPSAKMNVYPNRYCPGDKNSAVYIDVSGLLGYGDSITTRGEWTASSPLSVSRSTNSYGYSANYFLLLGVQHHVDYELRLSIDTNKIDPVTTRIPEGYIRWVTGPCSDGTNVRATSTGESLYPYDAVINYTARDSGIYSIECSTLHPYVDRSHSMIVGRTLYPERLCPFDFKVTCVRSLDWIVDGVTTDVSEAFSMYPTPYVLENSFVPGGVNSATISTNKPHRFLYLQSEGGVPGNYSNPGNVGTYHDVNGSFNIAQYYRNVGINAPSEETIEIFDTFQEKVVAKLQINGIVPYT